jgi:hypothetical protein
MELINKNVKALDPFSPNLTQEQKELILEEVRVNPEYFFTRILGAKAERYAWDAIRTLPQYPDKTPGDMDGDMLTWSEIEKKAIGTPPLFPPALSIGDYYREEMVDGPTWEWCDETWSRIYSANRDRYGEHMQAEFARAAREKFGSELARVRFVGMGVRYEQLVWGEWKEIERPISLDEYLGGKPAQFAEIYFPTVTVEPSSRYPTPSSLATYEELAQKAWSFTMVYFAHHQSPPHTVVATKFQDFWREVGPEMVSAEAIWKDEKYDKVSFKFKAGDGEWVYSLPGIRPREGHHFRRIDTGSSIIMPSVKAPMSTEELKFAAITAWNEVVKEHGNHPLVTEGQLECLFDREVIKAVGPNRVQVKVRAGEPSFSYRVEDQWIPL